MDNLEHGWLVGNRESSRNEFIGYCTECEETLYEDDDYDIIYGDVYCPHCARLKRERIREGLE